MRLLKAPEHAVQRDVGPVAAKPSLPREHRVLSVSVLPRNQSLGVSLSIDDSKMSSNLYFSFVAVAPSGQGFGFSTMENVPPPATNDDEDISSDDEDEDEDQEEDENNLPSYSFRPESDAEGDECCAPAVDVWYFARALETRYAPAVKPKPEDEPILTTKPRTPFVGCKACKKYAHSCPHAIHIC